MSLLQFSRTDSGFLRDVLVGLAADKKSLPCKYFYDEAGSRLFDRICRLPEYYPTRCETAILQRFAPTIMGQLEPGSTLIEYGSGSSIKSRLLLDCHRVASYIPVDISAEHLQRTAITLRREYPTLGVHPVVADFTRPFVLPRFRLDDRLRTVYFSGSTISNFAPPEAVKLLRQIAVLVGPGGSLIIAVDLLKDRAVVEPAYNDRQGVTAQFNLNLLQRINRELGGDFVVENYRHRALWNDQHGRIEMYLESLTEQTVHLGGNTFQFAANERICTEHSYKFSREGFAALAREAGLLVEQIWTDDAGLFSVQFARSVR